MIYLYITEVDDKLEFIEIEPGVKVERWFRW
jgi:hypothetical protein